MVVPDEFWRSVALATSAMIVCCFIGWLLVVVSVLCVCVCVCVSVDRCGSG